MRIQPTTRRRLILGGGSLALSACARITDADRMTSSPDVQHVLAHAESWDLRVQRLLQGGSSLAREYSLRDLSPSFKPNGTLHPGGEAYARSLAGGFADWRLEIGGMVARPLSLSLADLRRLPARTQITRHDCVEGWSAIGQWTGTPLALLLHAAGVLPGARYAVFYCADALGGEPAKGGAQSPGQYYESVGMDDAFHPQTLVAYAMNGAPLKVGNGAPLRLRIERQLGYKHAKYLQRIELVDSFARVHGGRGGYWEDRGYEWYAGI